MFITHYISTKNNPRPCLFVSKITNFILQNNYTIFKTVNKSPLTIPFSMQEHIYRVFHTAGLGDDAGVDEVDFVRAFYGV